MWLPSVNNAPVASSPLIADRQQTQTKTTLAPWAVSALPLSLQQTSDLLCACVGKQVLAPGVVIGNDLAF